jgi:hypothetical protein
MQPVNEPVIMTMRRRVFGKCQEPHDFAVRRHPSSR